MASETLSFVKEPFFKRYKRLIFIFIGLIFIGALIIAGWQIFFRKPISPSQFSLEASLIDSTGIDPKTVFILKSAQPFSEGIIKKIVKFSPEADFEVNKIGRESSMLSTVFAKTNENQNNLNIFEIKPAQPLKENEVYQVAISDPDYADRDYSWAFQVKALFQVIQTHPRDKGTYVPTNSGIEIIFNRENIINPEEYFSIEPKVEGTFEKHGDALVFLPKQLLGGTIYTVTIKKGIRSQDSNDTLNDDYVFAFETGGGEYSGSSPYLDFQDDFLEFTPDKNPTIGIYYYNIDFGGLEMSIYKIQNAEEFINSYQNTRNWQWNWSYYYWRWKGNNYKPDENQKILSFKPVVIKAGYQNFIEIPQALERGYYLLDTNVGGRHSQVWFQVTPLAHYFSVTHNKSILWINDFQKKEASENFKVFFHEKNSDTNLLGTTDKDGLIEFSTPDALKEENESSDNPMFFKVEGENCLPVVIKISDKWGYRQKVGKGDLYWNYLSTDRYTYQMNDTLRYWGVIKGREEDLRQKEVSVGIYNSYGCFGEEYYCGNGENKPLVSQKVLVSQFDTIQGELSFKGLSPGYYRVTTMMGDKVISTADIGVLTYSKPLYQITVTPSKNAIFADEKVDFKIKAEFFDGTPVSGLKLEYSGYWSVSHVDGEITLNENGEGDFSYTPKYYEGSSYYYPSSFSITFSPKLSEEGEISGSANVLVFGPNIYSQSFQEKQADGSYKFTVKLNHIVIENRDLDASNYWNSRDEYIGDPASNYPVSAKVIKVTYYKIETGQYYDPIDKVVRKQYYYGNREETIDEIFGTTNSGGEWSFNRSFTQEENIVYKIVFSGRDSKGRKFESYSHIWFFDYSSWKEFAIALNINDEAYEKQFSVGDRIKLQLQILEGETPANLKVLFYRYQNNIERVSIESALTLEENFSKEFIPSVQYRAVILGPYGFEESNSVNASFKEEDNKLTIDIKPEKEKYRPREEVKINLLVKDRNNNPISAEVNVVIVDEALFHILPYNWQRKILESLYQNVYTEPITGASQYVFLEKGGGAESGGCFGAGTPILMRDGSYKPIEKVRVGDRIITFSSENERIFAPAVVQGISSHLVDEYLIINNSLKVTPEHKIYINGRWDYAGNVKIGDVLVTNSGQPQRVYSVEKKKEKRVYVYNIVVGNYHTYFAGNYFVHNAEKGGEPRVNFVDVALYKTIRTDKSGEAKVSFVAPDNITAWRATAIAFSTEEIRAGQGIKLIKTSLPFFVEATTNDYYLMGDKPILRLRAFGDDYRMNQSTEFRITNSSLGLDKKEESVTGSVYIPLGELSKEGEYEITAWAKQGDLEDSIIKKIKVVKSYFRKAESSIYKLSSSLSNIEGNKDGFTELTFMDAGRGRFYQTLWWYVFMDGLRADQIIANYIGEKLLAQYFDEPEPDKQLDLSSYHIPEGGIGLFPYGDSDLEVSAKIADLVPDFVSQNELKNYFNKSLQDKKTDIHRIAKSLYGLASLKEPVLVKINLVKNNADLTFEDKIYLALALAKLGDKEGARKIYREEIRNQLRFQGQEAWFNQEEDIAKRVKLTGTIAVLSSYLNEKDDSSQLWNYISTHSPERDLDILETALFIKSELYLAQLQSQKAEFFYKTSTRSDSVTLEKGGIYTIVLSSDELATIKFENIKGEINLVSLYERSKNPEELTKNNELSITRKYFVNNQPVNSFKEGDIVLVRLDPNIDKSAIDGEYQIIDYLPSGLKPITRIYETGLSSGTVCDPIWYPSRVINNVSYFEISKGFEKPNCQNKTVNYYARVVFMGSYLVNPAIIQSLKDLNSLNISSKDSVEIK